MQAGNRENSVGSREVVPARIGAYKACNPSGKRVVLSVKKVNAGVGAIGQIICLGWLLDPTDVECGKRPTRKRNYRPQSEVSPFFCGPSGPIDFS